MKEGPMIQPRVQAFGRIGLLFLVGGVVLGLAALSPAALAQGVWLITPEEAAMPAAPLEQSRLQGGMPFDIGREVPDTGPMIELLKPNDGTSTPVLVEVSIRFEPRAAPVDLSTLKVMVVKLISIDITERVRPYASPQGIQIPDARLPSGTHTVRISLADTAGGFSRKQVTVSIP
jgi:hypothetical protein